MFEGKPPLRGYAVFAALDAIRVLDNLRRHIRAMPEIIPVTCVTKDDPVESFISAPIVGRSAT